MARKKKKKRTRRQIQGYAFVDTNVFLNFYRSRTEATLSLLKKLDQVKDRIICTYQIEMEFLKNRRKEILKIASDQQLKIGTVLPAALTNSQLDAALRKHKNGLDKRRKELDRQIVNTVKNLAIHNPIYSTLEGIFRSESDHTLTMTCRSGRR